MKKVLILGGIKEAADLAKKLVSEGNDVTTSLAGRTKEPKTLVGKTRIGGFGGAQGLADYLILEEIDLLIDCTHPFAKQISKNAKTAAKLAGIEIEIITRAPWQKQRGDQWNEVETLDEVREAIPKTARVLLALGSQHIDGFKTSDDVFFLVRMVDAPNQPLALPNHEILLGKPSLDPKQERAMLEANNITHIVCRNSGGSGAYAKIEAARELKLPVIMIAQLPPI